jgi:hypothetical protein
MVSIGYDFGDWLLKKRILKYVKFYSPQQAKLEVILDDFMAWHKKSELDQYILDVKGVKARFVGAKETPLTKSEIAGYLKQFRSRYFQSFNYLSEKMIPLFILLNSDQIERTKVLLGRKLDEKKDRSKILKSELIKQLERKWLENLEEWFGPLSPKQVHLLHSLIHLSFGQGMESAQITLSISLMKRTVLSAPSLCRNSLRIGKRKTFTLHGVMMSLLSW